MARWNSGDTREGWQRRLCGRTPCYRDLGQKRNGERLAEGARSMERDQRKTSPAGERQRRRERATGLEGDQYGGGRESATEAETGAKPVAMRSWESAADMERGSGGRCGPSESNLQRNKEISPCRSTRRLCGLIAAHAGEFNHFNVATAFCALLPDRAPHGIRRLSRLAVYHTGGRGGAVPAARIP